MAPFPEYGSHAEASRIGGILRKETVGGALLVVFAAIAIVWANTPWADTYFAIRDFEFGIEALHLKLSVGHWAADGLLAIFFFLVGLELKREFVAGDLRKFRTAIVPIAAAAGGVIVPALVYLSIAGQHEGLGRGWAIPTATDIAFAVAVLAIIGSHLPSPLRIFLLTLAVVDDLIAIGIIAIFYTEQIEGVPLIVGLACIGAYGYLAHAFRRFFGTKMFSAWIILLPIGMIAWAFIHASGIHATIAGVLLGFMVPVFYKGTLRAKGLAETFEHRFRPLSAGLAVPVFAFFAAGVDVGGWEGLVGSLTQPVTVGIIAALVIGKPIGITAVTWLALKISRRKLDASYAWIDVIGVGLLAGIGFTVSLLVTELSFAAGTEENDWAKAAVLKASVLAALLASIVLTVRNRRYKKIAEREQIDANEDGIPDVYQHGRD
ncbi:Na+/H+ antiporter NhaA [uncultured Agrococcus sp.]|uniref:Na+/H+ antiporter NhaA n=1 Tax=uncultured Agrococcus sp. TaxID=382258 RepID=UPI0025D17207|nr:Na+/H+ antiporter NhaA [uncultured Agrococcus sp.]